MTINELINGWKKEGNTYLFNELRIKKYVPYNQKIVMCNIIIKNSSYKLDKNGSRTSEIEINSPMCNLFFIMYLIKEYTNIEIDLKDSCNEYDVLKESGLLECIWEMLPADDVAQFKDILKFVRDDFIQNQMSIDAIIGRKIEQFISLFSVSAKPILNEFVNAIMKNLDENPENKETVKNFIKSFRK